MLSSKTLTHDIIQGFFKIILADKKNVYYLLYYSFLESILMLTIPLASSFIINALLAHASISAIVIGLIVLFVLTIVLIVQLTKEYIIEKFQQKIFVKNAIDMGELRFHTKQHPSDENDMHLNYFFDILSIQKIFPILILDGIGLLITVVISLFILLAFDVILFASGVVLFAIGVTGLLYWGRSGFEKAIERSDAKHEAIYYLQNLHKDATSQPLAKLDEHLDRYVTKRKNMFKVIISQISWMFFMEMIIISGFFIVGSILVIEGTLPVGEFVAAEIIVVTIGYAIHAFIKQLDYIYGMAEGVFKVNKLSKILEHAHHENV